MSPGSPRLDLRLELYRFLSGYGMLWYSLSSAGTTAG